MGDLSTNPLSGLAVHFFSALSGQLTQSRPTGDLLKPFRTFGQVLPRYCEGDEEELKIQALQTTFSKHSYSDL
jgi:hypothetical protein